MYAEIFTGAVRAMTAVWDTWNVIRVLMYSPAKQWEMPEGWWYCRITKLFPFLKELEFYKVQPSLKSLPSTANLSPYFTVCVLQVQQLCINLVRSFLVMEITRFEPTQLSLHRRIPCQVVMQSENKLDHIFKQCSKEGPGTVFRIVTSFYKNSHSRVIQNWQKRFHCD